MKLKPRKPTAIKEIEINEPNVEKTVLMKPKCSLQCECGSGSSEMGIAWAAGCKPSSVSAKSLSVLRSLIFRTGDNPWGPTSS